MKYVVYVESYGETEISKEQDGVRLGLRDEDDPNNYTFTYFSFDEFKEFRKAVGYVWQEVESNG